MNIVVYQIDTDTSFHEAKIVHEFSLSGVQALDAFWTPKGVVLVIGSAYDSDVFTNSVNTSIYRFSEAENKVLVMIRRTCKLRGYSAPEKKKF